MLFAATIAPRCAFMPELFRLRGGRGSAFTAESLRNQAIARGADLCLEKETPPREIASAVERLCRAA